MKQANFPHWIDRCIASRRVVFLSALLWIAIPVWFVWTGLPRVSVAVSQSIPVAWEKSLGNYVLGELPILLMAREPSSIPAERQERLQKRFAELAKIAQLPNTRLLFRTGRVNAVALPGNTVVVLDGLVSKLSDEQVMAVIAHELGHLHQRHTMQRIVSTSLMSGMVNALTSGNAQAGKTGGLFANAMISSAYSRAQEEQADTYAIQLLKASGESGLSFVQAMQFFHMHEQQNSIVSGGWASSHPGTQERLNRAAKEVLPAGISVKCHYARDMRPEFFCD